MRLYVQASRVDTVSYKHNKGTVVPQLNAALANMGDVAQAAEGEIMQEALTCTRLECSTEERG